MWGKHVASCMVCSGSKSYVQTAATTASEGLPGSRNMRAVRRERRDGLAAAETPQAFKEGARTLQNEQKRTRSVVLRRRGGLGGGDRLSLVGAKKEGVTQ